MSPFLSRVSRLVDKALAEILETELPTVSSSGAFLIVDEFHMLVRFHTAGYEGVLVTEPPRIGLHIHHVEPPYVPTGGLPYIHEIGS